MIPLVHGPCDEGIVRGHGASAPCADEAKPWILTATILGTSMAFIDGSVVNVGLPAIQSDLAASVSATQWIVNGYMLMLSALLLVGGAAGDRLGRRRVFAAGLTLFTFASVACGLAPSAGALIAGRALQGVGGALLVPSSLAIISAAYPAAERGRAIGTWAGFSSLTTAMGPVLGGWLVDSWGWRPIFFVNVPIGALSLWLVIRYVPESRSDDRGPLDWRGGLLAVLGLGALVQGFTAAASLDWTRPAVLGSLAAGVVILGFFLRHEARTESPLVSLRLFRSRSFSGANLLTLLLYFALAGAMFFLPFNLIRIQGYSAASAGAAFLPFSLGMGLLSRWSGGLIDRFGARPLLVTGPILTAVGFALLALPGIGGSFWTTFFPGMTVIGVGMTVSVAPLTTTVMESVPERFVGAASGVNNAVARLAGTLAVAVLGTVAVGVYRGRLAQGLAEAQVEGDLRVAMMREASRLAEARVPAGATSALRPALERLLAESFVSSYRVVMLIAAALALGGALCAALTMETGRRRAPDP